MVRAAGLVRHGRDDLRRAARAVHGPRRRAAAVDRRARRHRRPRRAHDQRRRGALARHPLRHPVDLRRRGHDRAHRRRGLPHRLRRWRWRSSSACRSSGSRPGATCGTPPTATCASGPRTPCSTVSSPSRPTAPARSTRSGSAARRRQRVDDALRDCYDAELYTLRLRLRWFPPVEFAFFAAGRRHPALGRLPRLAGHAAIGTVTAVALYVQQMAGPLDELIIVARRDPGRRDLAGPRHRHRRRPAGPRARPASARQTATSRSSDVRYAYRAGRDVLQRRLARPRSPASGSPSSAPRAPASPPSAGSSPASTVRARAGSRSAACGWSTSSSSSCAARSRSSPRSTTSSSARSWTTCCWPGPPPPRRAVVRAAGGRRARLGGRAAGRPRHGRRQRRARPDRGPGPAARAGPARARRPAHAGPRRGHLAARPARRPPPRAVARRGRGGPHGRRDRPPAAHRPRRRPGRRRRGRPDQRDRHPRGAVAADGAYAALWRSWRDEPAGSRS